MRLDYVKPIQTYTIEEFAEEVKMDIENLRSEEPLRHHYSYPNVTLSYLKGIHQWHVEREDIEESKTSFREEEILNYILEHVKQEDGKIIIRLAEVIDGIKYH